ncbi:hypothetical protein SLEP1_g52866 [Rubroshorea leprosula]|uniref:DUF1771 domain-containing protein n=1 Tax=Rubroshorea leprosula TaxID=152421 RepID=A0AAV5MBE6_9ROSI|nr:hypothetical protein SLEP1_g52866 [Rubroshorea leprosula]
MEVSSLTTSKYDEEMALKGLLDAFGAVFSLNDIASAYCKAGRNANLAGEILYEMQGSSSSSTTYSSDSEVRNEPSEPSNGYKSKDSCHTNEKFIGPKQKNRPASGGTISSILGKDYVKSIPLVNSSYSGAKPLKVDMRQFPPSEVWKEDAKSHPLRENPIRKDMEDFLLKMFGVKLDRDVIREVLESCAYDMEKSMEKLLDQSSLILDKEKKVLKESSTKIIDMHPTTEGPSQQRKMQPVISSGGDVLLNTNGEELTRQQKINDLQKDVLAAFFMGPERFDESPRRTVKSANRSIALGEPVVEPLGDLISEQKKTDMGNSQQDSKDDEDKEDSFQALRRAVREYWGTMKEYHKAAADAFAKGDQVRANKLIEQGNFFREKAREADEESNEKIFETRLASFSLNICFISFSMSGLVSLLTRDTETQEEMLLDLHEHDAKEAIRLLKHHLSSLAGIPLFKFLKVTIETNEEDSSKGARRRLIMKLLEKESISWTEGNPGSILIHLDKINPKRLSFAKK